MDSCWFRHLVIPSIAVSLFTSKLYPTYTEPSPSSDPCDPVSILNHALPDDLRHSVISTEFLTVYRFALVYVPEGLGKNGPGKNGPGKNGPEKTARGIIGLVVESVKTVRSFR